MKRFGIIAALCLLLFGLGMNVNAQEVPNLKGKFIYGGNFGGGMSGNYLNLSISPQVGYRILNPLELGVRSTYNLFCLFDRVYGNQSSHYLGGGPYASFQVYRGLFVHAEDEVLYGFSRWNHQTSAGQWFNSVFVGGGYRQYTYSGSYAYLLVLYNLSWNYIQTGTWDTPYSSPFEFRVGYCF